MGRSPTIRDGPRPRAPQGRACRYFAHEHLLSFAVAVLSTRAQRSTLLAVFAAAALALALPAAAGAANNGGKPNVVVITTDDQPLSMVNERYMPNTMRFLADKGTSFTDFIATTPLCCPSRATLITGQYGHNNGVLVNFYGNLREKGETLPVWLRRAGYRTAHIGKYLNGYENFTDPPTAVAPGWNQWFTQLAPRAYTDYAISQNGKLREFGDRRRDYLTTVLNRRAEKWAKQFAKSKRPLYLQLDQYAPHKSPGGAPCTDAAVPAPKDEGFFDAEPLPKPASFNELDVAEKPSFIQALTPIGAGAEKNITRRFRCAVESIQAVDRGVKRVRRALKKVNEWKQTVVLFTSDNGFLYGEHRIRQGKEFPYEENLHLPLILRVPKQFRDALPRVPTADQPVANIDIAPTILALAGADSCNGGDCRVMDGRSLLGLVKGDASAWPADRALAVEQSFCSYRGLRASGYKLIEHQSFLGPESDCIATDDAELYDLSADPLELSNLIEAPRESPTGLLQQQMKARMADLLVCAGIDGRDPAPPSGNYCE